MHSLIGILFRLKNVIDLFLIFNDLYIILKSIFAVESKKRRPKHKYMCVCVCVRVHVWARARVVCVVCGVCGVCVCTYFCINAFMQYWNYIKIIINILHCLKIFIVIR